MILPFLRHHLDRAARGETFKAFEHCHVKNLTSIVLHDQPGNRVRLFYARHGHELSPDMMGRLNLAIHPHHCDLTLIGVFGQAKNDTYAIVPHPTGTHEEFQYKSGILNESGSLIPTGNRAFVAPLDSQRITPEGIFMPAHALHTVSLPSYAEAAWLVVEGAEDPHYVSRCWTNGKTDLTGLYQPMTPAKVHDALAEVIRKTERPSA